MIERKNEKLMEEKKVSLKNGDPINVYVEDSMQLIIHKNVEKQRGEIYWLN